MPALVLKVSSLKFDRDDMFPREVSAQKGPTCWYYAARLIREFHDQTYKWNSIYDNTPGRQTEQEISAIRKMQTQLDQLLGELRRSESNIDVGARAGKLFDVLQMQAGKNSNFRQRVEKEFPQLAGKVQDTKQSPKGEFVAQVRQVFAKKELDGFSDRLWSAAIFGTLSTNDWRDIFARYGFKGTALKTVGDIQGLRTAIEQFGPLLCIGNYALTNYSTMGNMIEVGWQANKVDFDYVDKSLLSLQQGLHAIVVCGVAVGRDDPSLQIAVYKDPNRPDAYLGFDFDILTSQQGDLHGGENVFHLPCGNAAPCKHTTCSKAFH